MMMRILRKDQSKVILIAILIIISQWMMSCAPKIQDRTASGQTFIEVSDTNNPNSSLPDLAMYPLEKDFGEVGIGGESGAAIFTIQNLSSERLGQCSYPSFVDHDTIDFKVVSTDCTDPSSLDLGDTCSIEVIASPVLPGSKKTTLIWGCSEGVEVKSQTDGLTARSTNGTPTISSVALLGGAVEDSSYTIAYVALQAAANEFDPEGDTLKFIVDNVVSGQLKKDGNVVVEGVSTLEFGESWVWTPSLNDAGVIEAFKVKVTDGYSVSQNSASVFVNISNIDDLPTVLNNNALIVFENSLGNIITSDDLSINDPESGTNNLTYVVDVVPAFGNILKNNVILNPTDTFTQGDIDNNLITYDHVPALGTLEETFADSFDFHYEALPFVSAGVTYNITITPVNEPPIMGTNQSFTLYTYAQLPIDLIMSTNPEIIDTNLYRPISGPFNGVLSDCMGIGIALDSDSSCIYAPNDGYFGSDAFTYISYDVGGGDAITDATVSLTIKHRFEIGNVVTTIAHPSPLGVGPMDIAHDLGHIYTISSDDSSISWFSRNLGTGVPTYTGGDVLYASNMAGVNDVTVSPDSLNVYTVSYLDNAVNVFQRNRITGDLTYVESLLDSGLIDGLAGARRIRVTPDGRHVYATGQIDNGLAIFERNIVDGTLTFIDQRLDEINPGGSYGTPLGLQGSYGIWISPDGLFVYVTGRDENSINIFSRDPNDGQLTFIESLWDNTAGIEGLQGAEEIDSSPDGRYLYILGAGEDSICVFDRDPRDGSLSWLASYKNGINGIFGLSGATDIHVHPNGKAVWVSSPQLDTITVFRRDIGTGLLTYLESRSVNNISSLLIDPSTSDLYASSKDDDVIFHFRLDKPAEVNLAGDQVFIDGVNGLTDLDGVRSIKITPDGNQVYTASGNSNTIGVFDYDEVTKELTHAYTVATATGLTEVFDMAMDSSGRSIYTTSNFNHSVSAFSRDISTGELLKIGEFADGNIGVPPLGVTILDTNVINNPRGIVISPDDHFVYATSSGNNSLNVFLRNYSTGQLTWQNTLIVKDGVSGADGLQSPRGLAISKDGLNLYVAGFGENKIAVFERNITTGELYFVEVHEDGVLSVDGLDGANWIALSPDDRYVYVLGSGEDKMAIFDRDLTPGNQGKLTRTLPTPVIAVGNFPQRVLPSYDGRMVLVSSSGSSDIRSFSRSFIDGTLSATPGAVIIDNTGGIDGLLGAYAIGIDPSDQHVFVSGFDEDSINLLLRVDN